MGTPARKARYQHASAYVSDLRNTIGYYFGWIPSEFADKVSEEQAYEILKDDEVIFSRLELLSLFAAGEYVDCAGSNSELCALLKRALGYIKDFTHSRKSLIFNGNLFGLSIQKKYWKKVVWPDYPDLVWEVPERLVEVDRRRLRIERSIKDKQKRS